MRIDLELSQEDWDALEGSNTAMVIDTVEGVTIRLKDSLLTEERRCSHIEFCSPSVAGDKELPDGVHVRVWLSPDRKEGHVRDSGG